MKQRFWTLVLAVIAYLLVGTAQANQLERIRTNHHDAKTRVVLDLTEKPSYKAFRLTGPDRLVIDLKSTKLKAKLDGLKSPLIRRLRTSNPTAKGNLRLVLDLTQSASHKASVLAKSSQGYHRLVLDLVATGPSPSRGASAEPGRNVIIAIDAGHGGKDPGSIGPSGTYEKNVVLPIAQKLKAKIDAADGFEAFLVRNGDYFVGLDARSEKARGKKSDLLVSIHADAFSSPQPKGASVWVLSLRRANSEMGRWLERDDKLSELRGIGEVISESSQDDPHLQRTFLDLARQTSMMESQDLAGNMLKQMGRITTLHKKEPQFASLAVLKSPDFPSLLVETGFISNPQEERLLKSRAHQQKLADALARSILAHFRATPPRDSLLAQNQVHTVKSGESLSVIARRYDTTVAAIKRANQLSSDTVRIGQKLSIPLL